MALQAGVERSGFIKAFLKWFQGVDTSSTDKGPELVNGDNLESINAAGTARLALIGLDSNNQVNLPNGANITGNLLATVPTPATVNTAGNATFTAGAGNQIAPNSILARDCNGGARADNTPTLAQMLAAFPGVQVGQGFDFTIKNTSGGAFATTLTANGAGVSVVGTAATSQNNARVFSVVFTGVAGATPTGVQFISLGSSAF